MAINYMEVTEIYNAIVSELKPIAKRCGIKFRPILISTEYYHKMDGEISFHIFEDIGQRALQIEVQFNRSFFDPFSLIFVPADEAKLWISFHAPVPLEPNQTIRDYISQNAVAYTYTFKLEEA